MALVQNTTFVMLCNSSREANHTIRVKAVNICGQEAETIRSNITYLELESEKQEQVTREPQASPGPILYNAGLWHACRQLGNYSQAR